jgi:hypothetical protein
MPPHLIMRQSYTETVFGHRDSFKINPKPNTDGLIKCLPQPGQLRNQLFTSMLVASIHLLNFLHRD